MTWLFQEKDVTEKKLDKNVTVAKCCPTGQIFHQNSLGGDPTCAKSEISWKIPINGTFYDSTILVYDNRSKVKEILTHRFENKIVIL